MITVDYSPTEVAAKLDEEARSIIHDAVAKGQDVAQAEARVDTGQMRREIAIVPTPDGADLVAAAPESIFNEFGTGVYAESGLGRKTPWVYTPDGGRHFYVTRGLFPKPFMRPGYQAARAYIETEGRRRFNG